MEKYQDMVFFYAFRSTGDHEEAEDITQEAFCKAYESLSLFRGESQFSTWLFKITQNIAIERYRKKSKCNLISHSDQIEIYSKPNQEVTDTPETAYIKQEVSTILRNLVSKLPVNYKNTMELFYFENMSYKEISEKLNIKVNTLKSYIFRGKELIKEWLNEHKL